MSTGQTDKQGYDWTTGQQDPSATFDPNTYVVPSATATADADTIAERNSFRRIDKPGDYDLVIIGFTGRPEVKNRQTNHRGRAVSYLSASVVVKLADLKDRGQTIVDWFVLPPEDEKSLAYYTEGESDKGSVGFHSNKLVHFLNRIGFNWGAGQPMPDDARRLGNWIGRKVSAKTRMKEDDGKTDPSTGKPYPPQCEVIGFSYKAYDPTPAGGREPQPPSPLGGQSRPAAPPAADAHAGSPVHPTARPAAPASPAAPAAPAQPPPARARRPDLAAL